MKLDVPIGYEPPDYWAFTIESDKTHGVWFGMSVGTMSGGIFVDRDSARQLAALLLQAAGPVEQQWQPIETAPPDTTLLLAWRSLPSGNWQYEAAFAMHSNTMPKGSGLSNAYAHGSATHWRPLPETPVEQAAEEEQACAPTS